MPGVEPDYFVRVVRAGERDEMTIAVVSTRTGDQRAALVDEVEHALHVRFGLKIAVDVVAPGALDDLTHYRTSPKPIRFHDERE